MLFVGGLDRAEARPLYRSLFAKQYPDYKKNKEIKINCFVCHMKNDKGKPDTKKRNNYGKTLRKQLTSEGHEIGPKGEKDKARIKEAIVKIEKEKSAIKGKSFGDLIKDGKLPATQPEKK
jgi:hypothetical protein